MQKKPPKKGGFFCSLTGSAVYKGHILGRSVRTVKGEFLSMISRLRDCTAYFIIAILMLVGSSSAGVETTEAVNTLSYYFDLVASGNLTSAEGLWTEEATERSSRFGIEYDNIPVKKDCSSPIIRNLPVMRDYLQPPVKRVEVFSDSSYLRLEYSTVVKAQKITYDYYAYFDGSYFWLTYPQDYRSKGWPIIESKYFRVHYHPSRSEYIHQPALDAADDFVEAVADSLDLSKEDLKVIAEKKIEFFFCDTDERVKEITGHQIKGTFDMASNDIISAYFPHHHEVTHLLVNIKLKKLPLYTQPIMREGLAVYLGGRWGKGTSAISYLGRFLIQEDVIQLDELMSMKRFEQQAVSDMAYPVAGVFTDFLIKKIGMDEYLDLYRLLSGPIDSLTEMKAPAVKRVIYTALGYDSWEKCREDFDSYLKDLPDNAKQFLPGIDDRGKVILSTDELQLRQKGKWLSLVVKGESALPTGNLLFGYDDRLKGTSSLLFDDQYSKGEVFLGYRYGIRFDSNEAGLYDYVNNTLVGKYVWGLTPSDSYIDSTSFSLNMKFLHDLCKGAKISDGHYKMLSH